MRYYCLLRYYFWCELVNLLFTIFNTRVKNFVILILFSSQHLIHDQRKWHFQTGLMFVHYFIYLMFVLMFVHYFIYLIFVHCSLFYLSDICSINGCSLFYFSDICSYVCSLFHLSDSSHNSIHSSIPSSRSSIHKLLEAACLAPIRSSSQVLDTLVTLTHQHLVELILLPVATKGCQLEEQPTTLLCQRQLLVRGTTVNQQSRWVQLTCFDWYHEWNRIWFYVELNLNLLACNWINNIDKSRCQCSKDQSNQRWHQSHLRLGHYY